VPKHSEGAALEPPPGESQIVVLVNPQLADNIGMAARAMANGGLFHMRLVAPRDGWPQERAFFVSSGAQRILEAATVHATVDDAIADCHRVFATCPRPCHVVTRIADARAAAADLRRINAEGQRVALLFGPERAGLTAEDLARADTLVRYPLNPAHNSLNLAQAVMIMGYEWWMAEVPPAPITLHTNETQVATRASLENFMGHLLDELDACGFLRNEAKRPGMVRNLRHWFTRGEITEQELRTLHGVVAELSRGRMRHGRPERQ